MNFIQRGIQSIINYAFPIEKDVYEAESARLRQGLSVLGNYYEGKQALPLKVRSHDFNVITNHAKTIVDRTVSMLLGGGVEFDLPGEADTAQDKLINLIWDANKKNVLLHDLVQFGSIYGTPFIKIVPGGKTSLTGVVTDRLVALNPYNVSIFTQPDDIEQIQAYVYRWTVGDEAWREVTENQGTSWMITTQKTGRGGKWETVGEVTWSYPYSPIVHGKNLPNAGNVYGMSDIEGILDLQNKYNEAQSNINKILGLQAYAQKYVIGGKWPRTRDEQGNEVLDMSPETALEIQNGVDKAQVGILQPTGDLGSSRQFATDIMRDLYEVSATVDGNSVKDKVGALTNFGLRVLFKNELAKNATKQMLYSDLLCTVNNRLLQLHGFNGEESDPGKIVWGDPLPRDEKEKIESVTSKVDLGIMSLESAAKEFGIDWKVEQERLANQKTTETNAGAEIIKSLLTRG